jgi:hypothetical protein
MASIVSLPINISFANNDLKVVTASSHITTNQMAFVQIELTGSTGPSVNETLVISINGTEYTFTFVATPTSSYEIATKGSLSISNWFLYLEEYFRSHPIFSDIFTTVRLTDAGTPRIRLNYKKVEVVELIIDNPSPITDLGFTSQSITEITDVENLSAWIAVCDATTHEVLIKKVGNYDVSTGECSFAINEAFDDLTPTVPNPVFVLPTVAAGSFRHFYIRYADKFGNPSVTEARQSSAIRTVIAGGTSSGNNLPFLGDSVIVLRENTVNHLPPITNQPSLITYRQPDWVYLCAAYDLQNIFYDVLIMLDDNTTLLHEPELFFELKRGETQYIATGYRQLGLHTLSAIPSGKKVVGYDVRFRHDSLGIFYTQSYEVDPFTRHPWNVYILFDNGLGGMETVRLKGKRILKYNAEITTYENDSGELSTAFAEGVESVEVSTGYYTLEYIQKLRQLLLGKLYQVTIAQGVTDQYTFTKIIADTKSFEIIPDDNDLHALVFTFKKAKMERQHNGY